MDPNDNEKLKEDVKALKLELNRYKDENRILLAKTEQYKKRATYAKSKYYEIKHASQSSQA
jgi:predicted RNase H-like nuclease (RuvC/YqgF family)